MRSIGAVVCARGGEIRRPPARVPVPQQSEGTGRQGGVEELRYFEAYKANKISSEVTESLRLRPKFLLSKDPSASMFGLFQKLFNKDQSRKRKTTPIETTPLFDSYTRENEANFDHLTKDNNGSVVSKKLEATQRFNEFLWRLDQRYRQLKSIESYIYHSEPENMTVPMKDAQIEFVNRVEAYYQQLYASLSAFAMFLNHVAPHSFKRRLPISSITEFLEFLKTKTDIGIKDEIVELERARDFRAKFVDHTQQHALHNWMTFSYPTRIGSECVVIYYISRGPEVYFRPHSNPYAADFKPPVNYESFYVSPPHNECHQSMFSLCQKVISEISDPDPETLGSEEKNC